REIKQHRVGRLGQRRARRWIRPFQQRVRGSGRSQHTDPRKRENGDQQDRPQRSHSTLTGCWLPAADRERDHRARAIPPTHSPAAPTTSPAIPTASAVDAEAALLSAAWIAADSLADWAFRRCASCRFDGACCGNSIPAGSCALSNVVGDDFTVMFTLWPWMWPKRWKV